MVPRVPWLPASLGFWFLSEGPGACVPWQVAAAGCRTSWAAVRCWG